MYQIIVALGLGPPGTLVERLRNLNQNVDTQLKHVTRYPRVSTPKKNKAGKKVNIVMSFISLDMAETSQEGLCRRLPEEISTQCPLG